MLRWAAVVCAATTALVMSAQSGGTVIAGTVYQDRLALSVRPHFLAAENVTLKLYRDDGDRTPSAGDLLLSTTKSDKAGMYVFKIGGAAAYWVVVDSRSFHGQGWPEQTFGPAGSLCTHPDQGTIATMYEGSCFGGRTAHGSDDASSLTTAEHLAFVNVRESVTSVDFAFSYDAVTNTLDGENIQGSLRQYFQNANEVRGINRMRFVPVERAVDKRDRNYGIAPRWWTITLKTPLPELRDDDTLVDGSAFNYLAPSTIVDPHPGRFGEPSTIKSGEPILSRLKKPELELIAGGPAGIVCAARCGLRELAIHGAAAGIVTRADVRVEHVLVGVAPDGDRIPGGEVGVQVERGTFTARHLLVASQRRVGISVSPGAKLDGEHLEINYNGEPLTGAGIGLFSQGSSIRTSVVSANPGAGILLGSTDGKAPAIANTIDGTTISGNQAGIVIGPGSSRNTITHNDIMWNRIGGVTIAPFDNADPPRENRISANRFDENGLRPIILDLTTENPNALAVRRESCAIAANAPNGGISAPRVTDVVVSQEDGLRAVIRGRACPGQIVEIYQSFATSGVREKAPEIPEVRDEDTNSETLTNDTRAFALPSIGEFNYLGTTTTSADGTFSAAFPLPSSSGVRPTGSDTEGTTAWNTEVLPTESLDDRAFAAIAIDPAGNTSEMSVRRKTD